MRCYELETINRASSGWGVREGFVREGFPGKKTLVWPPVTLVRVEVSWCVVKEELPWIGNSKYPWARMRLIGIGHSESYRPVWSLSDWRNTVIAFRTTLCLIFGVLSPPKVRRYWMVLCMAVTDVTCILNISLCSTAEKRLQRGKSG